MSNVAWLVSNQDQPNPIPVPDNPQAQNDVSSPKKGWLVPIFKILFVLILVGLVVWGYGYYTQSQKLTKNDLSNLSQPFDFNLNQAYLIPASVGWKESTYEGLKISHPNSWVAKPYNIGLGPSMAFSIKNGEAALIIIDASTSTYAKNCAEFTKLTSESIAKMQGAVEGASNPEAFQVTSYKGTLKLNDADVPITISEINTQGFSSQALNFCITKNGKDYFGMLQERGNNRQFVHLADTVVVLHKLK